MHKLLFLLLIVYVGIGKAQTLCDDQLLNYYFRLGTLYSVDETHPLLNPINVSFINGTSVGVQIEFLFGSIARLYESLTPGIEGPPLPVINYVSFDYPWCTTSVNVICGTALLRNLPKNGSCNIVDYDVLGPNFAGRAFIYNDDDAQPECNGNIIIQLFGDFSIVENNTEFITTYTYSFTGLIPGDEGERNLTLQEALAEYQRSLCVPSDGFALPTVREGQDQLVCRGNTLAQVVCRATRPRRPSDPLLPVPSYACRGVGPTGEPNGTRIVWFVNVYGETASDTIGGARYDLHFCESYNATCIAQFDNVTYRYATFSGTRTQFISDFSDFESGVVLDYVIDGFGNSESFTRPVYPFAVTDPFIRDIPCICCLSIDCGPDGAPELGQISKILNPNNALPVANATGNLFILPGVQTITLDASASFDPDNLPNPLTFYWKVYNSTPTPVTIDDPSSPIINVTADFALGVYRFVVYVSDCQEKVYDLVNISVQLNVIRVILPPDFDAQWQFITVCPAPGDELSLIPFAIILNGSATFGENPSIPLFYNWTQISGNPIPTPFQCNPATVDYHNVEGFFNRNESIAYFIPASYGIYTFCLNVSDGGISPSRSKCIHISVELNFDGPNSTNRNYTDYPDAPIYNFSNGSVPTISFPPISPAPVNDLTRSPSNNDPVPTPIPAPLPPPPTFNETVNVTVPPITIIPGFGSIIFPVLREPSLVDWAILLLAIVCMVYGWVLLFGACCITLEEDYAHSRYDRVATNAY